MNRMVMAERRMNVERLSGHEDYEELSNEPAFSKMVKEWKAYRSTGLSPADIPALSARAEAAEARADALVKEVRRLRQEKQEREKGCEYCADHEDLAFGHDSMKRVGSIYIDGNLLVADLYSESMAVAVCFCPMCGKSLKEVADER